MHQDVKFIEALGREWRSSSLWKQMVVLMAIGGPPRLWATSCTTDGFRVTCQIQYANCSFSKDNPYVQKAGLPFLTPAEPFFSVISPPGVTWDGNNMGGLADICGGNPAATGMSSSSLLVWGNDYIIQNTQSVDRDVTDGNAFQYDNSDRFWAWLKQQCSSYGCPSPQLKTATVTYSWKNDGWVSPLMKGQENFAVAQGWQDWDVASKYMAQWKPAGNAPCKLFLENPNPPYTFRADALNQKCTLPICEDKVNQGTALQYEPRDAFYGGFDCKSNYGRQLECAITTGPTGKLGLDCADDPFWDREQAVCAVQNQIPVARPMNMDLNAPQPGTCVGWPANFNGGGLRVGDKFGNVGCKGRYHCPVPTVGDPQPDCPMKCYEAKNWSLSPLCTECWKNHDPTDSSQPKQPSQTQK